MWILGLKGKCLYVILCLILIILYIHKVPTFLFFYKRTHTYIHFICFYLSVCLSLCSHVSLALFLSDSLSLSIYLSPSVSVSLPRLSLSLSPLPHAPSLLPCPPSFLALLSLSLFLFLNLPISHLCSRFASPPQAPKHRIPSKQAASLTTHVPLCKPGYYLVHAWACLLPVIAALHGRRSFR